MAKQLEVYKCEVCGNIVEVLHGGVGELVCCNQPMVNLQAKTADEGKEKHVPVIEKVNGGIKVKIGSVPHPMEEKHYIEWIEVIADGKAYRQFLKPGQAPEAVFFLEKSRAGVVTYKTKEDKELTITAREHCNVHGLWEGK